MKIFFFIAAITFNCSLLLSQNVTNSIYDYVLNYYLKNRVQTSDYLIQRQLTSLKGIVFQNLDSLSSEWNELALSSIKSQDKSRRIQFKQVKHKLISKRIIERALERVITENGITVKDPIKNWRRFQQNHANCAGIVFLSHPILNKDMSKFMLFVEFYVPSDKGFGNLILCKKDNGLWKISQEYNLTKPIRERIVVPVHDQ